MLSIIVSDDGRGVEVEQLRQKIVSKQLTTADIEVADLTEVERIGVSLLPAFSTKEQVTEISSRGVGLDVVHDMVQEVGGTVSSGLLEPGKGMCFYLQLPSTLSVLRTPSGEIAGEPYAFPLARIDRALILPKDDIDTVANRCSTSPWTGSISLVSAHQVLDPGTLRAMAPPWLVIVISDRLTCSGLVGSAGRATWWCSRWMRAWAILDISAPRP